jgi:hypothetical protein
MTIQSSLIGGLAVLALLYQPGMQPATDKVDTGDYEIVENWPRPLPDRTPGEHDGYTWGSGGGVYAQSPDRVWIVQRGERPLPPGAKPWTVGSLLKPPRMDSGRDDYGNERGWARRWHHNVFAVDRNGNAVVEWLHLDAFFSPPNTLARGPHKIRMSPYDPQKHVWIIDDDLHEIHKFTPDGKLVMTLGERGVPGRGPNNFNRPTDMVWLPDGTFFISDGYAGTRVAKFDRNGKFLLDWGEVPKDPANPGPNEFYSVHSIGVTRDRRLVVSDREHSRMQIFDENGKFLTMWRVGPKAEVYSHIVTEDDHVWAADHTTSKIIKFDLNGKELFSFGGPGPHPGQFNGVHQIHVDQERNLYVTEVWNGRVQKFRPKKGADPAKIIAPEVGGWPPT